MLMCSTYLSAEVLGQATIADFNRKNITVEEAVNEIEKLLHVNFFFNHKDVDISRKMDIHLKNAGLEEFILQVFGTEYKHRIVDNLVIISRKDSPAQQAQTIKVEGSVKDQHGTPLPGVTVVIRGTTTGTATDLNGRYSLTMPEGEHTLLFSMIGMKTREEVVGQRTTINVVLEEDIQAMDEIIVNGYFSQNKNSYTGAVRTITREELQQGGNQNILTSLQNLDPSFTRIENNAAGSNPNVIPDFQIRGAGSFNIDTDFQGNPNMPVFILDGFEVSAEKVFDMDNYRVNTITILKDAAATAIYGSRASNGVVVITTLAPESGQMNVSYNFDATLYAADLSGYNLTNASEKLEIERRAGMYEMPGYINEQNTMDQIYSQKLANIQKGYNTYWLDKPLDSFAVSTKHTLRLDGGNEYIRYALELNYNKTPGVMKESGRQRVGMGVTLQYTHNQLTFRNLTTYSSMKADNSPYGLFQTYTRLNPYVRYKDDDGNYTYVLFTDNRPHMPNYYQYNPLYNATLNTTDQEKYNEFINNFSVDWRIWENTRLKGSLSITKRNNEYDNFKPAKHTDFASWTGENFDRRGSYEGRRGDVFGYEGSLVLSSSHRFDKHLISANLGYNIQETQSKSFTVKTQGFPNENLDYISFATQYEEGGSPSGNESLSRLVGFFGNANYSFDERFLADLSIREDASSRFGAKNRWASFWSVGAGWNLHNEAFIKTVQWINLFKIRASYGITGSQNYNPNQALTTYRYFTGERYHNAVGVGVITLGNDKLKWQRKQKQNYGLDLELWNNRITLNANYYIETSTDELTSVTLPPSLGFASYMENLGEVENKGFDASMRLTLLRDPAKRLHWSVTANAVHNTNKLKKISNALTAYNDVMDREVSGTGETANRPRVRFVEGQSMNTIWVNKSLGVDPATGYELFMAKNGDVVSTWSAENYIAGGCEDPDVEGTFGSNLSYKGFQLNLTFRYRYGGEIYNRTLVEKVQDADLRNNVDRRVYTQRWNKPGDQVMFTNFGGFYGANVGVLTRATSRFVETNHFLELATLNMAYEFDAAPLEHIGIKRLKLSFYMNDVFRSSSVKIERGTDYPFARNFSLGLQARF